MSVLGTQPNQRMIPQQPLGYVHGCPWRFFNAPGMAFEKHRILKWMASACHTHHQLLASACQVVSKSGIFIYCNCNSNSNRLKCVVPEISLPTARQIEIQEANHSKTTFIYPDLKVVYGSSLISSVMCLSITSN